MNEHEDIELEALEASETEADNMPKASDSCDEVALLRAELEALRGELSKRDELDRANSRMNAELSEFSEYFPETELASIPDEIWEKVKRGASLSATYALYLRKNEERQKKIGDFNEKNRRMSAGSLLKGESEKYYSPSEVKRMTPAQVKSNYDDIIASMKHWN